MKRRIFGFQRRVWWPKWTPASSSCFMVTTATGLSLGCDLGPPRPSVKTERPWVAGVRILGSGQTLHPSWLQCRSGHRDGLHPVWSGETHGEDEAAGTGAD